MLVSTTEKFSRLLGESSAKVAGKLDLVSVNLCEGFSDPGQLFGVNIVEADDFVIEVGEVTVRVGDSLDVVGFFLELKVDSDIDVGVICGHFASFGRRW